MLVQTHGKHEHGLRMRDLDRNDRQNFEAVERIINASHLLDHIPGTKAYIDVTKSVIYSYLDKEMEPIERLEEIWFGTIFLRYWRKWIQLNRCYSIKENFITSNAYMCTEVNAHCLLMMILMFQNNHTDEGSFLPWMLTSQACESTFRTARSMTGMFSTYHHNLSMLNLLQRMHKLQILEDMQSISEKNKHGISFPRQERCSKGKAGRRSKKMSFSLATITNDVIVETLRKSLVRAQSRITQLGMDVHLKEANQWSMFTMKQVRTWTMMKTTKM